MNPNELIQRYLHGEATDAEVAELGRLLASDRDLRRTLIVEMGQVLQRRHGPGIGIEAIVLLELFGELVGEDRTGFRHEGLKPPPRCVIEGHGSILLHNEI